MYETGWRGRNRNRKLCIVETLSKHLRRRLETCDLDRRAICMALCHENEKTIE